ILLWFTQYFVNAELAGAGDGVDQLVRWSAYPRGRQPPTVLQLDDEAARARVVALQKRRAGRAESQKSGGEGVAVGGRVGDEGRQERALDGLPGARVDHMPIAATVDRE